MENEIILWEPARNVEENKIGALTLFFSGARVSHPQQPGLPDERTKFHGYWSCRMCCGWDSRAPPAPKAQ
jgi:hypothetical protein